MIEVTILIPINDNNGKTFDPALDDQFLEMLDTLFGGSSRLPGLVAGRWVSAGVTYQDQNRVFAVFIDGLLQDGHKVIDAVEYAKLLYSQLAVTARYLGHAEIL